MKRGQCHQRQPKSCERNTSVDPLARSGEETKIWSSSQNQCKNPEKEVFSFLLYLKCNRKALTSQPSALSEALCGDPDVDRCCDLFSLASRVGVVDHLCWQEVKQTSYNHSRKRPFRRSQAGCPPCSLLGQHQGCSLATDHLSLSQGPRSGGLSESHFKVTCLAATFVKYFHHREHFFDRKHSPVARS
jgi:hypothetical protein